MILWLYNIDAICLLERNFPTLSTTAEAHNSVAIYNRSYLSTRAQFSSLEHTTRFCGYILWILFVYKGTHHGL